MNELVLANRAADWRRLKMLALDSASSRSPVFVIAQWRSWTSVTSARNYP
jgi:hypothetical protein